MDEEYDYDYDFCWGNSNIDYLRTPRPDFRKLDFDLGDLEVIDSYN